jgi:mono/diheme cytochrome c family protein
MTMKKILIALILVGAVAGSTATPCRAAEETKAERREMIRLGAQLWPVYCNQCHNARPGSEFAPYQWDQIIMHMRALPNLPAQDVRAIVEYLKSGRE